MKVVDMGVDFGATGMRAVFGAGGEPAGRAEMRGTAWPWLAFEPPEHPAGPASFPSVKSRLGFTGGLLVGGRRADPVVLVAAALAELCERALDGPGTRLGRTVITVPSRFSSRQRSALLDASRSAGLGEAVLLSDTMAAVAARGAAADEIHLVCLAGYSGTELGLVKTDRGRYRALSYRDVSEPAGEAVDRRLLESLLATLHSRGDRLDELVRDEDGWRVLRRAAEELKEGLAYGKTRFALSGIGGILEFDGSTVERFEAFVGAQVQTAVAQAAAMLAESGTEWKDVDRWLLAGGTARMGAVYEGVVEAATARDVPVSVLPPDALAEGAFRHACELSSADGPAADRPPSRTGSVAPSPAPTATAAERPARPLSATLAVAERLLADGRLGEAERLALGVHAAAEDLLRRIRTSRPGGPREPAFTPTQSSTPAPALTPAHTFPPEPAATPGADDPVPDGTVSERAEKHADASEDPAPASPDRYLAQARKRLAQGRFAEGVHLMHLAWQRDETDLDVFEEMIQAHCDAAMHEPSISKFGEQIEFLKCASRHDHGNPAILDLLAERTFIHGRELHREGRRADAIRALDNALKWNPDHEAAGKLLRRLNGMR